MKKSKQLLALLLSLTVAFTMCFGSMGVAFAEGEETPTVAQEGTEEALDVVLTVICGDKKAYFAQIGDELFQCDADGKNVSEYPMPTYSGDYSAINNNAQPDSVTDAYGPSIIDLVECAAAESELEGASVTFADKDGWDCTMPWSEITAKRYSYSSVLNMELDEGEYEMGNAVTSDEKGKRVEPIVNLASKGTVAIGQRAQTDRNKSAFTKGVGTGGTITINKEGATAFDASSLELEDSCISLEEATTDGAKLKNVDSVKASIYYEIGQEPTYRSSIYNYKTKKGTLVKELNFDNYGVYDIKVRVMGPTGLASEVKTLKLTVADEPIDASKVNVTTSKYVYNGKAKVPSVSVSGLTKDKDYTVQYADNVKVGLGTVTVAGTNKYYGSTTKSFTIYPAKASIKKIKKGNKKLTVSFKSQKASGVDGYVISYKRTGFKAKYTKKVYVSKNATSKTIKKLKKNKKYTIKVAAYKNINGKKVYGSWSDYKRQRTK